MYKIVSKLFNKVIPIPCSLSSEIIVYAKKVNEARILNQNIENESRNTFKEKHYLEGNLVLSLQQFASKLAFWGGK